MKISDHSQKVSSKTQTRLLLTYQGIKYTVAMRAKSMRKQKLPNDWKLLCLQKNM